MENKTVKRSIILKVALGGIAAIAVLLLLCSIDFVKENRYLCVRRFGVVRVYDEPGLIFKAPFIDVTDELPKSLLNYEMTRSGVMTADKKSMIADSFTTWEISDPIVFLSEVITVESGEQKLSASVYSAIKNIIATKNQEEIITARGDELNNLITEMVREDIGKQYGIYIQKVQVKALDLPEDNLDAVYERMISERKLIEETYRNEGEQKAALIENEGNRVASKTIADAKAEAEKIIAEGEEEYMKIMREAYGTEDKLEFYQFVKGLDTLEAVMQGETKTIFIPLDSELGQYFK